MDYFFSFLHATSVLLMLTGVKVCLAHDVHVRYKAEGL